MRTIIAGSRTIRNFTLLKKAVEESGFPISEIISGGAPGVDKLGEDYAAVADIDLVIFKANWRKHGKAAGSIRNKKMVEYAASDKSRRGGLIALWDGQNRGIKNMIENAVEHNLKVYIYRTDK
jgi:hypothetical protein